MFVENLSRSVKDKFHDQKLTLALRKAFQLESQSMRE